MTANSENQGRDTSNTGPPHDSGAPWDPSRLESLLAEANALALYIARHGDAILVEETSSQASYVDLLSAIAAVTESPSASDWQRLMTAYASVTTVTYRKQGVNGCTILDTAGSHLHSLAPSDEGWGKRSMRTQLRWVGTRRFRPVWIGVGLFVVALAMEVAMTPTIVAADAFSARLAVGLAPLLFPALWGGIGACTFLMKRLSDKLFELSYEQSRQRGEVVRIVLGAVIGVVATQLFVEFSSDGNRLPVMTTAFVAGLGVKPVYAAFEALIEGLARRLGSGG